MSQFFVKAINRLEILVERVKIVILYKFTKSE